MSPWLQGEQAKAWGRGWTGLPEVTGPGGGRARAQVRAPLQHCPFLMAPDISLNLLCERCVHLGESGRTWGTDPTVSWATFLSSRDTDLLEPNEWTQGPGSP